MVNQWTDSGGGGAQGVEISGIMDETPYLPWSVMRPPCLTMWASVCVWSV